MSTFIRDLQDIPKHTEVEQKHKVHQQQIHAPIDIQEKKTTIVHSQFFTETDLVMLILLYTSSTDLLDKLISHYYYFGTTVTSIIKICILFVVYKLVSNEKK